MRIELDKIGKQYQEDWIFNDCSYSFKPGQKYALTGFNGSGKSTLLKIIAGYLDPSNGTIYYQSEKEKIERNDFYKYISYSAPYSELIEEFSAKEMLNFHFKFKSPFNPRVL